MQNTASTVILALFFLLLSFFLEADADAFSILQESFLCVRSTPPSFLPSFIVFVMFVELKFEWDEEKDRINRQKHGISFETASYVFRDEYYIEMYDFEHSINEDRYVAIGMVGNLLFIVFTERGENIRLISARLATENERRLYYDQNFYN